MEKGNSREEMESFVWCLSHRSCLPGPGSGGAKHARIQPIPKTSLWLQLIPKTSLPEALESRVLQNSLCSPQDERGGQEWGRGGVG